MKKMYVAKRVITRLDVRLMPGKKVRDVWSDFFSGDVPDGVFTRNVRTGIFLGDIEIPEKAYEKFAENGASKEFLDKFEIRSESQPERVCGIKLVEEIGKVIKFNEPDNITSGITEYVLNQYSDSDLGFTIEYETSTWYNAVSEDALREINKENARMLRKRLVGLPSVQGVPYNCKYREDDIKEERCPI